MAETEEIEEVGTQENKIDAPAGKTKAKKEKKKKIKKEKVKTKTKKDGGKKGKAGLIIFLITMILVIGTIFALIRLNVFGLGDKLRPPLEKIPIVKNILPPAAEQDEFANLTKDELIGSNKKLEQTNTSYEEVINSLNEQIKELNIEIARLREVEDSQVQFKSDKEEFDRLIALNDPKAYASFYESVSPENAEAIYKEALQQNQVTKEFKTYAQTFESMKKDAAATVLEELIASDIDLVVKILENLSSEKRADILASMSSQNAAMCVKKMTP